MYADVADEVAEAAYLLQRPVIGQADPAWLRISEAMGSSIHTIPYASPTSNGPWYLHRPLPPTNSRTTLAYP